MSGSLHANDSSRDVLITIGAIVALVLIAVGLLIVLDPNANAASRKKKEAQVAMLGEIEMLETETRAYKVRVAQMKENVSDLQKLKSFEKDIELTQEARINNKLAIFEVQQAILDAQNAIDDHMDSYRDIQRKSSRGRMLGDITTKKGTRYSSAKILGVDDIGIEFSHAGGVSRVSFQDLGVKMQEEFGYDKTLALLAKKREKEIEQYFARQSKEPKVPQQTEPGETVETSKDELFDDYLAKLSVMRLLEANTLKAMEEAKRNPTKALNSFSIVTWSQHAKKLQVRLKGMQKNLALLEAELIKHDKNAARFIRKEKRKTAIRGL